MLYRNNPLLLIDPPLIVSALEGEEYVAVAELAIVRGRLNVIGPSAPLSENVVPLTAVVPAPLIVPPSHVRVLVAERFPAPVSVPDFK